MPDYSLCDAEKTPSSVMREFFTSNKIGLEKTKPQVGFIFSTSLLDSIQTRFI